MKVMHCAAALLFGGGLLHSALATDLRVLAGQTHRLEPALADAHFATWQLGDGAILILPEGVAQWRWQVDRAEIGQGVRILGAGSDGAAGAAGQDRSGRAASCRNGVAGGAGGAGGVGGAGANVDLRLGIAALGSLAIEVPGGHGGAGGAGGRGQDGGHARTCPGGDGGDGGVGGAGGAGGDGGRVRVRYYAIPNADVGLDPAAAIRISAEPGQGGAGGEGGTGGKGGEGGYVQARTLTGNQKWMSGGKDGRLGSTGEAGASGERTQAQIEPDVDRRLDQLLEGNSRPVSVAPTTPAESDQLRAMERELEAMRRRLEALEKAQQR